VDDIDDPIGADERDLGDPRGVHALCQQHHLRATPRDHRATVRRRMRNSRLPSSLPIARSATLPAMTAPLAAHQTARDSTIRNNHPCRQRGKRCQSRH
jgi:hypothetical protein